MRKTRESAQITLLLSKDIMISELLLLASDGGQPTLETQALIGVGGKTS